MKRIFTLLAGFLFLAAFSPAQPIPNNSFEVWTYYGTYAMPDHWDNLNPTTAPSGIFTCTVGTPGNPGLAYLQLTSRDILGSGVVPGVAVCGILDPVKRKPVSGFQFTERPEKFMGSWQYMMFGSGKGFMEVFLTKWKAGAGERDTIASLHWPLNGMVMSWENFSLSLVYHNQQYPDTCIIFVSSSGPVAANYDYLYLDGLAFTGYVPTGIPAAGKNNDQLRIIPNPAGETINLISDMNIPGTAAIRIFNSTGDNVKELSVAVSRGKNAITIEKGELKPGMYTIILISPDGSATGKVIIK